MRPVKISIRDLVVDYEPVEGAATHRALQQVSLDVQTNEFLCVVGPSGCGKSTLISAIAGFIAPRSGSIQMDGRVVDRPGADRGVVFQEYALLPWKNVLDNVALGLQFKGVPRAQRQQTARQYLELVNLKDVEKKYPHELSGGMRQRVAVARTLAMNPQIMMMDEPFAAIDAQNRMTLQEELIRVRSSFEVTVLFVTHSVEEAVFLADRVAVMTPGPGRIREIVDIPIPRTARNWQTLASDRLFISLRDRILALARSAA
jgi:NitT/TauT family transport system ATP-binding protein